MEGKARTRAQLRRNPKVNADTSPKQRLKRDELGSAVTAT
jgi:hypothetical protein